MKSTVVKNDRFSEALSKFLHKLDRSEKDGEITYVSLKKNLEEMSNLDHTFRLNSYSFVENQSVSLILPNTGGSTSIMALYWVYISTADEGQIVVKSGESEKFDRFVETLNDDRISVHKSREEFAKTNSVEDSDLLVVYGSDETCRRISRKRDVLKRSVFYPSKTSIAIINDPEKIHYEGLARDLFSYDGLGCLSPSVIYTTSSGKLVEGLSPHVPLDYSIEKTIFDYKHNKKLDRGIVRRELGEEPKTSQGFGTVVVVEYSDVEDIEEDLDDYRGKISCVVVDREPKRDILGATRYCRVGEAQTPPLRWRHDGTHSLFSLVDMIGVG